jgi:DNA-binding MarR family transcriptional regulator
MKQGFAETRCCDVGYPPLVTASTRYPGGEDRTHSLGYLLWEMSARLTVLSEAALAGTSLTMPALGMLQRISDNPGITVAELARSGPRSSQALSQIAGRLEKLGYLERRLADGRGVALHITSAGERARQRGAGIEAEFEEQLARRLGARRYQDLCELLEQSRALVRDLPPSRRPASATPE